MTIKQELLGLVEKMNANPTYIGDEKDRVFQVNLVDGDSLQIVLRGGKVEVADGAPHEPEITLTLSEQNFSKLLKDDLNTTMAFMTGSLKVDGKLGLALKLQEIVKKYQ